MPELSLKQRDALDAYAALMERRPELFSARRARPIVRDRDALAAYVHAHDVILGVAADTPFVLFVVDLVESRQPDGRVHQYPYMRVISRAQLDGGTNVVVLATIDDPSLGQVGAVVLVQQDRHALGTRETELPRGFGTAGLSGETSALRELEEETGYMGDHARFLGATYSDSGLSDSMVSFYHVPVVRHTRPSREIGESIAGVELANLDEVRHRIRSGVIRDGFTVQALALYEAAGRR